ncbi:ADP-ribose pyrophosphatase [invertebrate metagenome]|uniref:ADP-ribose pyrophosphatase n=1 Tax=invertebrate metagenome TaxID=1711999 RepID=A0A2H9T510_9ZZZZ
MKLPTFDAEDVKIKGKTLRHDGFLTLSEYQLCHKRFDGQWSPVIEREVITRPLSIGVLLYDPAVDSVVLIEQFRPGALLGNTYPWLLEIVAGISESGETPETVAHREVKEESGCLMKELLPVMTFYPTPGASNEKLKLFCGIVDADSAGTLCGVREEGEDIRVHVIPFKQACKMIEEGSILNAPAIIALQWLALHHQEMKQHA